jgi:geranylgeranyl diphosphate synthase, type II
MTEHVELIEGHIQRWCATLPAGELYAPMSYLLRLPGKRVRPTLVLMGCELFGGKAEEALDAALGIELFHNFTLMHDDIMDASPLRRGEPTVHVKWNANTAILSGDAMLVKAYHLMSKHPNALEIFGRYALEVCEGQQMDMDFERRNDVRVEEYTAMIRQKTAVLLNCALQLGAVVAGADHMDRERLGAFGEHVGLAFQLRDDLLDAFGEPAKTGKQKGGDLRNGKKTFLLIRGLELEGKKAYEQRTLHNELAKPIAERDVERMIDVIEQLGVRAEAEMEITRHDAIAHEQLDAVCVEEARKVPLRVLAERLLDRTH